MAMFDRQDFTQSYNQEYVNFRTESVQSSPNQMPPIPMQNQIRTPYDYFRKPRQPEDLLGNAPLKGSESNAAGIMTYFQNEEGEFDLDKFFAATGQMTNMFQRVMPIVMRLASVARGGG